MQLYYFYRHNSENTIFMSVQEQQQHTLEFLWVDSLRQDLVNHSETWQNNIYEQTGIVLNEFHMRDLLNIEHPCAFDTVEEYDLLVFRKLISADDQIYENDPVLDVHESVFGLATTPMSFILTPRILVSFREQGNMAVENYVQRLQMVMERAILEQNKPRKLPSTPADLCLRLLNSMIDGYLNLRTPLTRRVEYWQQQLLQGNRRFKQWHQLFHEDMAFQQIENLCEEQIETLQEFRDELVDNYHHVVGERKYKTQDILLVRLNDLMSHIERVQKHTLRLRNAIQSAIDLHFSATANQTNENMRILAIITAVFAPLTLLTGIYGMNFEFIPGLKSPVGFWIMLGVMLMTTILLLYYFYQQHLVGRGERSVIDLLAQQHKQRNINLLWFLDYEPIKQTLKEVEKMTKLK
ncbi:magnesium transporter CorA family protein [Acinetobacter haemolyticus]|uniref:magnesium transporter CorA family protein n=1 Tax=Acinetobacter haemolyticus TaxID=29430 RepID=UPI000E56CEB3|nr:magnesium transporter CorA family protein [Acinetobacter haemolyticus]NAR88299.1 magnesium transporter [Acinetobacter haemolyticus]NAR94610.1 magnesium transporter [Acinetobacter haemolyticus]NAS01015.1 magnesium transporter [Acinetobacter haemolyticus]QDJ93468.1 magnesium transporter CorA family protein [Acinetobacter haemolyticus]QHI33750.1 magnesium transporter [Acinetobacter haemolyticus]